MSNLFWDTLFKVRNFFGGWISEHVLELQIASIVLSALFIWSALYVTLKSSYWSIKKEGFKDMLKVDAKTILKDRFTRSWKQIKKWIMSSEPEEWKKAILESDRILNEIFKMSGYVGHRLEDKLDLITPAQLANIEEIKKVHEIAHRIHNEPDFQLSFDEAVGILRAYKAAFIELRLINE